MSVAITLLFYASFRGALAWGAYTASHPAAERWTNVAFYVVLFSAVTLVVFQTL